MSQELAKVMLEGQQKTLEAMELMKKQVAGTITPAEETRLAMLNGNLLALAGQAVDLGFDPQAVIEQTRAVVEAPEVDAEDYGFGDEDEVDLFADEDDFDEDVDEGYGYGRGGYLY